MAKVSFSIIDLLNLQAGNENDLDPQFNPVTDDTGNRDGGLVRKENGNVAGSPFYATDPVTGREYYMPVAISFPDNGGAATADIPNKVGGTTTTGPAPIRPLKKWYLPHPTVSIGSKKTIVETPLTERRGTVKELINIQDYEIIVRGKIINKTNELPETTMQQMAGIYEVNIPVYLSSPLTDIFLVRPDRGGSDQVILKEVRVPEVVGVKSVRPYELVFVSDEPFNLIKII